MILKKIHPFLILFFLAAPVFIDAQEQSGIDSTGLPGDQFSLQGALHLFKESANIGDFEKALNLAGNHVNNLDLNGDGETDYVTVIDKTEKEAHAFILRALVSATESQDIAVIELEKTGPETAVIQIVGDEDIFGESLIVEPVSEEGTAFEEWQNNSGAGGPAFLTDDYRPGIVINVWYWPSVRFVYGPVYRPWASPWRWAYFPPWWKPWHPLAWHIWHPYHTGFRVHYGIVSTHRVVYAHKIYLPYRTGSVMVHTRHSAAVGHYRVTRSRTTVIGPGGKKTTVKKTTVKGPRGGKATRVRVRRH